MQKPRSGGKRPSSPKGAGTSRKSESRNLSSSKSTKSRKASSSSHPSGEKKEYGSRPSKGGYTDKDERGYRGSDGGKSGSYSSSKSAKPRSGTLSSRSSDEKKEYGSRPSKGGYTDKDERGYRGSDGRKSSSYSSSKSAKPRSGSFSSRSSDEKKEYGSRPSKGGYAERSDRGFKGRDDRKSPYKSRSTSSSPRTPKKEGEMRLNKYLSNAGIASRRDADELIKLGLVTVNGKVVTEMGYKVDTSKDVVKYDDKSIRPEKLRYVLLNKPKDYITTMDDPQERKTVMSLIHGACPERVYPVGRLDRQTLGLLLFTNDGELAKKLTHPRHNVSKLYHVETVEKVKGTDLDAMRKGVRLDDGTIIPDDVSFVDDDPRQVGIRIHSGKNRVVRRIFEHFNYTIKKLDRVMFAGLTKKDLSRGRYRHLTEQEVAFLKMIR